MLDGPPEGLIAPLMATALGLPEEPATIDTDAAGGPPSSKGEGGVDPE